MRKIKTALLATFLLLISSPFALAGWNGIEWGMSQEKVMKILQSQKLGVNNVQIRNALTEEDKNKNITYLSGNYTSKYGTTDIDFKFDGKKHLLSVSYRIPVKKCDQVTSDFKRQYGNPMRDDYLFRSKSGDFKATNWYTPKDEIRISSVTTGKGGMCTLTFGPL